jgi:hypothetical protein
MVYVELGYFVVVCVKFNCISLRQGGLRTSGLVKLGWVIWG